MADGPHHDEANLLGGETSPYLLQHKNNPVHWRPWGDAALAEARDTGKPILLSIGYAACHWCHVMAHESFENEAIATLMNRHFVNIKVDREERPDLDAIYQAALSMMGEHGGWPLTMFLTPSGEPFWGGTYFPPEPRFGRPGFPQILEQLARVHADEPDKVEANKSALGEGLKKLSVPAGGGEMPLSTADDMALAALQIVDFDKGGTRGAPKFPQPSLFRFFWNAHLRTGDERLARAVTLTLDQLCQGGIYDHLGGGFARYSVDDEWLVPHFEKMLYDNALLVELMADVHLRTKSDLYAARIRETVEWMRRELAVDAGGETAFVSAYDADSEGVEGKFYTWREDEIRSVLTDAGLGDAADDVLRTYRTMDGGNWEGVNILNRNPAESDTADRLDPARRVLFDHRAKRVWPGRDDKVLADWNGHAIAALARAGHVMDEPDWIDAAESAFHFVAANMTTENGRLLHAWCAGKARHAAVIDDYANMARAALMLHQATGDQAYLDAARRWTDIANTHYWDDANGAYFQAADDTRDLIVRNKVVFDNATPSGNGIMAEALARLWLLTGEGTYRDRAARLVRALTPEDPRGLLNQPSLASAIALLEDGLQIVVAGEGDAAADLIRAAATHAPPLAVIQLVPEDGLPDGHPAHGKGPVGLADGGVPAAYVCRGPVCGLPLTDPAALAAALGDRA